MIFFREKRILLHFQISCLLILSKREIGAANHFNVISVVNPEDAVVVLPAAVGATVFHHKNLSEEYKNNMDYNILN